MLRLLCLMVLMLGVEVTLLSLARWQYHRYQQRITERSTQAAAVGQTLTGVFLTGGAVLDNQPHPFDADRIGWRLLTPLQTSASIIVVDRGWMPLPRDRFADPDLLAYAPPAGPVSITGLWQAVTPRHGWLQGPETTTQPHILARLNPVLVHPQAEASRILQLSRPLPGQASALVSKVAPTANPATHFSYFIQWLAMAFIFPLLCLYAWWRRTR